MLIEVYHTFRDREVVRSGDFVQEVEDEFQDLIETNASVMEISTFIMPS